MPAVTEISELLQEKPVTVGDPINAIFSFTIVEDPPGSGLYILPTGVSEDPPASGLYQFAGLTFIDAGGGLYMLEFDWVLQVERLVGDPDGGVWDLSEWATGESDTNPDAGIWATLEWESLNDVLRGMEWTRGADQPNGRPRNGEIVVTLTNEDDGENDPWVNYSNVRPGTILRAGLTSATDTRADGWLPLWTGIVESWTPKYVGARSSGYRADSYAEVRLVETLSWLARIDRNATSLVGSGDTVVERINRLLIAAEWPYGLTTLFAPAGEPTTPLQSTDMNVNRLSELYLTADSAGAVVRSDVTGAALVTDRNHVHASRLADFSTGDIGFGDQPMIALDIADDMSGVLWEVGYNPDTFETVNDPEGVVNDHRYTRVGGTQQLFEHPISIGTFGRSTRARSDLICTTDAAAFALAEGDNDREALTALRVDNVEVVATGRYNALLAAGAVDIGDNIWIFPPAVVGFDGSAFGLVRSMSHTITPMRGAVHWTVSYALDLYSFVNLPGSILPEA